MRRLIAITLFEFKRFLTNWRKMLTIFLLPATIMLAALYLFPAVVNYLSTGSIGRTKVYVINEPESFSRYLDNMKINMLFDFQATESINDEKTLIEQCRKGAIILQFNKSFDSDVNSYLSSLVRAYENQENISTIESTSRKGTISLSYLENSTLESRALQMKRDIIEDYQDKLPSLTDIDISELPSDIITVNSFNPITDMMINRAVSNTQASRIVPGILVLMIYYCVYSLCMDSFAGDRERGFFTKLKMAPVSIKKIVLGKSITIVIMTSIGVFVVLAMLFLASWLNWSNDSLSLLPFGFFLFPNQLLKIFILAVSAILITIAYDILIIFSLQKPFDITLNLQLPIAYILLELFVFMFRPDKPTLAEYLIPFHNVLTNMFDIVKSQDSLSRLMLTVLLNLLITLLLFGRVWKKEEMR